MIIDIIAHVCQYVSIQRFVKAHVAQYVELLSHTAVSMTKTGKRFHYKIGVVFFYGAGVTIAAFPVSMTRLRGQSA